MPGVIQAIRNAQRVRVVASIDRIIIKHQPASTILVHRPPLIVTRSILIYRGLPSSAWRILDPKRHAEILVARTIQIRTNNITRRPTIRY